MELARLIDEEYIYTVTFRHSPMGGSYVAQMQAYDQKTRTYGRRYIQKSFGYGKSAEDQILEWYENPSKYKDQMKEF